MNAIGRHRRDVLLAAGIVGLALVLRLLVISWLHPAIPVEPSRAKDDSWFYTYSAWAMRRGHGYVHPYRLAGTAPGPQSFAPTADHPPVYTVLLTGAFLLPGPDLLNGRLLNAAVGALGCGLLFVAGRIAAGRAVGVAAGLLMTFLPSHVFYTSLPITEVMFSTAITIVILLCVIALARGAGVGWRYLVALGIAMGLATMVRGEAVLLFLVFGGAWWYARRSFKEAARVTGLVALGVAVIIGGWTVRNQVQLGAPIPISTGSSVLLSISHWDGANGGGDIIRGIAVTFYYDKVPYPEREVKAYRKQTNDALRYAVTHPAQEASLVPRRIFYLYEDDHTAVDWVAHYDLPASKGTLDRFREISDAYYYSAAVLAVVGIWLWWRVRPGVALLLVGSMLYITALMGIVFFGTPRYHAGFMPVVCLLAAPALAAAAQRAAVLGRRLQPGS